MAFIYQRLGHYTQSHSCGISLLRAHSHPIRTHNTIHIYTYHLPASNPSAIACAAVDDRDRAFTLLPIRECARRSLRSYPPRPTRSYPHSAYYTTWHPHTRSRICCAHMLSGGSDGVGKII